MQCLPFAPPHKPTVIPVFLLRAFRLRCPRCGEGQLYSSLFRMHKACPHCGYDFQREPGFYLGSIYINYGWTALITVVGFVVLRLGFDFPRGPLLIGFTTFCVIFPLLFFHHARALWLAMDFNFDPTGGRPRQPANPEENPPARTES